jgi:hypothetical protein
MSRLLLGVTLALMVAGCERLNPDWCKKPGRCPAGTTCDPTTNTCLGTPKDARVDSPVTVDRRMGEPVLQPDLKPDAPIVCKGGLICDNGAVATCREAGASSVVRNCPISGCADGHCLIPQGAKACTTNAVCPTLPQQWVCTWLLDKGTPKQVCAQSVPGSELAVACTSGTECATGLCTLEGQCYHACNDGSQCALPRQCLDCTVDIEGVPKTVKSCREP